MNTIFLDTETTGKWDFKLWFDSPKQPHLLQLAAIRDEGGRAVAEYETLVHLPFGVMIEEGALAVHGITEVQAFENGVPLHTALENLSAFLSDCDRIVCHNTAFDIPVLQCAYARADLPWPTGAPTYCTMKSATNICKLPGPYGYKWPTLDEAYRILVNPDGFEGAHDALSDVRACRAVYHALTNT